jgi:hypothetical protein
MNEGAPQSENVPLNQYGNKEPSHFTKDGDFKRIRSTEAGRAHLDEIQEKKKAIESSGLDFMREQILGKDSDCPLHGKALEMFLSHWKVPLSSDTHSRLIIP